MGYIYISQRFFFGCKVLVNKDVLLGDVVRSDFFFWSYFLSWVGCRGWGENRGYSLILAFFFFLSRNMVT